MDIDGHWAADSVTQLVNAGVISGYPDNTFRPDQTITRGEFTVLLVNAFKIMPQSGKVFTDTSQHWAKDYIATAQHYGIVHGISDSSFAPDVTITREQMAVMLVNAAGLKAAGSPKAFSDTALISPWAIESVNIATSNGFINGLPNNSFLPQGKATRAEASVVLAKTLAPDIKKR